MDNSSKPDFNQGIAFALIPDGGLLLGTAGGEDVILVRRGEQLFAVGATCTHYHGPLAEGLIVGDSVRCPLHHACFSLHTGEALRAPALDPIPCWRVERIDGTVFVREKRAATAGDAMVPQPSRRKTHELRRVVIVGGGAAGLCAADALRRTGYQGELALLSADDSPPCERPNLSKDFLMGTAPEEWMPLRPPEYYAAQNIDLMLNTRVAALDVAQRRVTLEAGGQLTFDALLLATGADPVRLSIPGATDSRICYLRTFADARRIIGKAAAAKRVVIVGAGFIGLEVAASLRARGIEVHVVGIENVPMARVLGEPAGRFIQSLHESHGVRFHLGVSVGGMEGAKITLSDGTVIDADFMILGVGVRPATALAEKAGLAVDRGVVVDEYLQTSAPGVFAAGDMARWPDPHSGGRIRVEHWVVAQRQGRAAALNMQGAGEKFAAVPFFWSQHYDLTVNYVGHAEQWDAADLEGSFESRDFSISYRRGRQMLALATVARDRQSLAAELAMESQG